MASGVQKKFMWASGIVMCAIVALLLLGVNVWFNSAAQDRTEQVLHFIMNYGSSPGLALHADGSDYAARLLESTGLTPREALDSSLYFTAETDGQSLLSVDMTGSASLDPQQAQELAQTALSQGNERGRVGPFEYIRDRTAQGVTKYAFLNTAESMLEGAQLGAVSFGGGSIAAAAILASIWLIVAAWVRRRATLSATETHPASDAAVSHEKNLDEAPQTDVSREQYVVVNSSSGVDVVQMTPSSLTEAVVRACNEIRTPVKERGGELITDIQPNVYIRTHDGEAQTLCRLLDWEAVRTMRDGGSVHVDLQSDGREVDLTVESEGEPWHDGAAPEGAGLAAVKLIARDNDGLASFEALEPDRLCYTVHFKAVNENDETQDWSRHIKHECDE